MNESGISIRSSPRDFEKEWLRVNKVGAHERFVSNHLGQYALQISVAGSVTDYDVI